MNLHIKNYAKPLMQLEMKVKMRFTYLLVGLTSKKIPNCYGDIVDF